MDDRVLATVAERAVNPFLLLEPDGRIAWVSDTMEDLLGRPPEQVVGTSILDWLDDASRQVAISTLADIDAVLASGPQPRSTR